MKQITEQGYINAAKIIGCEVAAIKAVKEVESGGSGFLPDGQCKILFEPHIFYRELMRKGIKPTISDICYPKWGTYKYGKVSEQHGKLQRAVLIDRECALKSASWGLFQICGFNYKNCGCKDVQEFVTRMIESEDSQLELFAKFINNSGYADELIEKRWKDFARLYNGAGFAKNQYDTKLAAAYKKYI